MPTPTHGVFKNNIPYARTGAGSKTLLMFSGGPGNGLPGGFGLSMYTGGLKPLLSEYTLWLVSRRSGLTPGCTTRHMSDDYAEMIHAEFGGHADLAIGVSYGGMIIQHFAADHADLCDHLVIAMATHRLKPEGGALDMRYAELLAQGKDRQAGALVAQAIVPPGIKRTVFSAAMWLMGSAITGSESSTFASDVLIEAQAELAHNADDALPRIPVPVLILVGEQDFYFTADSARQMAAIIPHATLKIYPGKGHEIITEKRFAADIAEFISTRPGD
jgi:pimeloyl-ACP methyl ester carboxylesterase